MSPFLFLALMASTICTVSIFAVFFLLYRPAKPQPDSLEELVRSFERRRERLYKRHQAQFEKKRKRADRFDAEKWFEEIAADFERQREAQERFRGRSYGAAHQNPVTQRSWRTVLGVGTAATLVEARAAFRKIVKETHPESAGANANPARLQEAVEAYDAARRELRM